MGVFVPPTLMWINRIWIFALADGTPALDWGEGMAQELGSGLFVCYALGTRGPSLSDNELAALIPTNRVAQFTETQVAIYAWSLQ